MPRTANDAMIRIDTILREGWWMELCSPFTAGSDWYCALNLIGTTVWDGHPGIEAVGSTAVEAIENCCNAWETRENGKPEEEVEK